jgi:hypothetical protein
MGYHGNWNALNTDPVIKGMDGVGAWDCLGVTRHVFGRTVCIDYMINMFGDTVYRCCSDVCCTAVCSDYRVNMFSNTIYRCYTDVFTDYKIKHIRVTVYRCCTDVY